MNEPLLPTVKVVRSDLPDGYMLINQEDFDPDTQELYQEETPKTSKKTKTADTGNPPTEV